jgi:hypothetical protein
MKWRFAPLLKQHIMLVFSEKARNQAIFFLKIVPYPSFLQFQIRDQLFPPPPFVFPPKSVQTDVEILPHLDHKHLDSFMAFNG